MITIRTQNVSLDGTELKPNSSAGPATITKTETLAALEAFVRQPVAEASALEAQIHLRSPGGNMAVEPGIGGLIVTRLPKGPNVFFNSTPAGIVQALAEAGTTLISATPDALGVELEPKREPRRLGRLMGSPWLLALTLGIGAVVAYFSLETTLVAALAAIRDPMQIENLRTRTNGTYAMAEITSQTMLILADGRINGYRFALVDTGKEKLFSATYGFTRSDNRTYILVDNGAKLEILPEGGLKFEDSIYSRLRTDGSPHGESGK